MVARGSPWTTTLFQIVNVGTVGTCSNAVCALKPGRGPLFNLQGNREGINIFLIPLADLTPRYAARIMPKHFQSQAIFRKCLRKNLKVDLIPFINLISCYSSLGMYGSLGKKIPTIDCSTAFLTGSSSTITAEFQEIFKTFSVHTVSGDLKQS